MPLKFFKPNKFNTGSAASFTINSKGAAMYAEIVQQMTWNDKTQTATFYDHTNKQHGNKVQVKFTRDEVGALVYAIQTRKNDFSTVHKSDKQTTTINFGLLYKWDKASKTYLTDQPATGFSLTINRKLNDNPNDKANFKMAFTFAEAIVFMEWCRFAFEKMFSAIYAEDKKRAEAKSEQNAKSGVEDHVENETVVTPVDDEF